MSDPLEPSILENYRNYLTTIATPLWHEQLLAKQDVGDLVQDTLLTAFQKFDTFRGGGLAELAAWLRTMLANKIADEIRSLRREKRDVGLERSIEAALEASSTRLRSCLIADDSTPSDRLMANERLARLADALGKLPPDQCEAITLHHLQRLSLKDTAQRMDKSPQSVAGLLRRGLKGLREQIVE